MMRLLPFIIFTIVTAILAFNIVGRSQPADAVAGEYVAKPAPKLQLTEIDGFGGTPTIESFKGSYILVSFFASWCQPCLAEHPLLLDLAKKHPKLVLYGIGWKDNASALTKWLKQHGNPYSHVGIDRYSATAITYGITGVPESFLIDPKGNIVSHASGPLTANAISSTITPILSQ